MHHSSAFSYLTAPSTYPQENHNTGHNPFVPPRITPRRPGFTMSNFPESVLLRLLSHCDEEMQLEAALVCRGWLILSRKVYFSSYTIQSTSNYRLLLLLLQPGSSVRAEYVVRLDASFTSDESTPGPTGSRRAPPHVSASDLHRLVNQLVCLESLRVDWIGARGASAMKVAASSPMHVPSTSIPAFLTIPRLLQRLRHLEIRGGSWPLDSLLQSLAYMPRLISISMENIYEPTTVAMVLPSVTPAYQLTRLSIARCTLSGETVTWLLSTSQQTLRHLAVNSLRRRPGSSSFNSALAMVGPALETLRARNFLEVPRCDPESLLRAGFGYCPNLRTLVIWCDTPVAGPFLPGVGGPSNSSQYSPSLAGNISLRSMESRPPSRNHPYPRLASLSGSPSLRGYGQGAFQDPLSELNPHIAQSPSSPPPMSASLPSPTSQPPSGTILPILVTIIQQDWLPSLKRLVISPGQIEASLTRVECHAELSRRGITLGDMWSTN